MDLNPKNRAEVYYDRILKQLDDISNGTSDSESGSEGLNPVNRAETYYKMILDKIDEIADGGSGGDIDPAVIEQAVSDWLTAHPEATTTTVTDGSITYNKLDTNLKGKTDAVDSLSDEVTDLKSALAEITDNSQIVYRNGNYYYNTGTIGSTVDFDSPGVASGWQTVIIECTEGDKFTITATGGNSSKAWAFLDSSKKVIANEPNSGLITEKVITAPENTAYLILNNKKSETPNVKSYYGKLIGIRVTDLEAADVLIETRIDDLQESIYEVTEMLPSETSTAAFVKIEGTTEGDSVNLSFTQMTGNRVYCGGKNLFDGQIQNIALGSGITVTGSSYRGFVVPIKGGRKYTISRSSKSSGKFRFGITSAYPQNNTPLCVNDVQIADNNLSYVYEAPYSHSEAKYIVCYLSNSSADVSSTNFWVVEGTSAGTYEEYNGTLITTDVSKANGTAADGMTVCWCDSGDISVGIVESVNEYVKKAIQGTSKKIATSNTGNFSIVCAKEHAYDDGSLPVVEYYLIEECTTNKFYLTKDFKNKTYLFTFNGNSRQYSFGILQNGDVIACKLADALQSGKDDSHRVNPYCWLSSENWSIQHEVDFGQNLKPCGWLSNCGFKVMADGTPMFVEYTRMTVATANVWKINGTPAVASNWTVLKSFEITTEDNQTGFKHIHMVTQDPFTSVIYISTGDDDNNAKIFYTSDFGTTWTQLGTPSQKYCRNLMFTFTKDYIYWAPDTTADSARYLFRAERDANGVLDFSSIEDYVHIGGNGIIAAYGQSYIPELNAILVLDRCDGETATMPVKLIDLTAGELHTIGTLESPSGNQLVGFRTRYSEWYPRNGLIYIGFGFRTVSLFNCVNHNKGFGNAGYSNTGDGVSNINNLSIQVYQNDNGFGFALDTMY